MSFIQLASLSLSPRSVQVYTRVSFRARKAGRKRDSKRPVSRARRSGRSAASRRCGRARRVSLARRGHVAVGYASAARFTALVDDGTGGHSAFGIRGLTRCPDLVVVSACASTCAQDVTLTPVGWYGA